MIEFQETLSETTYENLDKNGFKPYGIAVIKSSKENSNVIIQDLKDNKKFFFENSSNLI